jgi:Fe-S cluster biogenesis protein NfuA/nitrite reductase/ring-hydroxylating ferredoxin subunit
MSLNSAAKTMELPSSGISVAKPADEPRRKARRIQELVEQIEALPNPAARTLLHECLQATLAFHGQGLTRMLEVVEDSGPGGEKIFERLIHDEVVRGLLLIHGLHPVDLETRLREALTKVRPYMESHGGNVELISLEGDVARLRLQGTCKSCPSSAITMELAVRHAVEEACPDLMGFEVEGMNPLKTPQVTNLESGSNPAAWTVLETLDELRNGDVRITEAAGVTLAICKVNGNLYAYRNLCPACGLSFDSVALQAGWLVCRLGHQYDVQRAGSGVDNATRHLDPFPLITESGAVKVSVR